MHMSFVPIVDAAGGLVLKCVLVSGKKVHRDFETLFGNGMVEATGEGFGVNIDTRSGGQDTKTAQLFRLQIILMVNNSGRSLIWPGVPALCR